MMNMRKKAKNGNPAAIFIFMRPSGLLVPLGALRGCLVDFGGFGGLMR